MPRARFLVLVLAVPLLAPAAPAGAGPVPGTTCSVFPADNVWHSDISTMPVHARSADWLTSMGGPTRRLHPDFGPSDMPMAYGIPYEVVPPGRAKVAVSFEYDDESDHVPYPFAATTPIEGGADSDGDRHALMVDPATCTLYELFSARYGANGTSTAGSGAVFDLRSNALRPAGWTSTDAAGLPVFAGLLRRDEVLAGNVDHAIRVTASATDRSYVWPARHQAGRENNPALPPMGARFRLRADFDVSGFRPDTQVVLRAFKKHGLILADNGSNWYFQGTADHAWDPDFISELKSVTAANFEAVDASSLMVHPDSGATRVSAGARPVAFRDGRWSVRGAAGFTYGQAGDLPVMGDWNGDGVKTAAVFRNGTWYVRGGSSFAFGRRGDVPVAGDWDGDGDDTAGVFRDGRWFLSDGPVRAFTYGRPGDQPVAGDWDADGRDTVGFLRGGAWYLTDRLGNVPATPRFRYGVTGDRAVSGDWNDDGRDTVGVVRGVTWYLRDANSAGPPSYPGFGHGATGDRFLSG